MLILGPLGTHYLTPPAFWLGAGAEPAKSAAQPLLQPKHEVQVAQRSAGPPVTTDRLHLGVVRLGQEQPAPIVHQVPRLVTTRRWRARQDSNLQPSDSKSATLSVELRAQGLVEKGVTASSGKTTLTVTTTAAAP